MSQKSAVERPRLPGRKGRLSVYQKLLVSEPGGGGGEGVGLQDRWEGYVVWRQWGGRGSGSSPATQAEETTSSLK